MTDEKLVKYLNYKYESDSPVKTATILKDGTSVRVKKAWGDGVEVVYDTDLDLDDYYRWLVTEELNTEVLE